MSEQRVWLAQCLCPQRHCIMGGYDEATSKIDAKFIIAKLRWTVEERIRTGEIDPWCGICGAKVNTWHYEIGCTRWRTKAEAKPHIDQVESNNLFTKAMFEFLGLGRGRR